MKIGNFIKIETPGNISFEDDKLRVSTHNSITSILFEDISSLSVRYSSGVNMKYLILGLLSIFFRTYYNFINFFIRNYNGWYRW
jgi:hypothetical protein